MYDVDECDVTDVDECDVTDDDGNADDDTNDDDDDGDYDIDDCYNENEEMDYHKGSSIPQHTFHNNDTGSSSTSEPTSVIKNVQVQGIYDVDECDVTDDDGNADDDMNDYHDDGNSDSDDYFDGYEEVDYHKSSSIQQHTFQNKDTGSSSTSEPASVIKNLQGQGIYVGTMAMDNNTASISHIKQTLRNKIEKWSDLDHMIIQLENALNSLGQKNKQLTSAVIKHLKRWFAYAINQNRENVVECQRAIQQIVPHAFGMHNDCVKWCSFLRNPDSYKYKTLLHMKDHHGDCLQKDLESVFNFFVTNACKIIIMNPKRCHSTGSEQFETQGNCDASQKSQGHQCLMAVNNLPDRLPSTTGNMNAERIYKKRKLLSLTDFSKDLKRRRLIQKEEINLDVNAKVNQEDINQKAEINLDVNDKVSQEGITYEPSVANTSTTCRAQKEERPPPIIPIITQVTSMNFERVYFDLETGSLAKGADILQISAISGSHEFNKYVTPTKSISPKVSDITGLSSHEGMLMLHGKPVSSIPIKDALHLFIAWLKNLGTCLLIAHNVSFDARIICYHLQNGKLVSSFTKVACGFLDTLPFFKVTFPGQINYKQETLVSNILKESYEAHNALADVRALKKLMDVCAATDEQIRGKAFSTQSYFEKKYNLNTLQVLIKSKVLSDNMANKMAMSGLQQHHLIYSIQNEGFEGLQSLLSEKVSGKPRVTETKKVISKVFDFLSA
ncbi:unnamed protein product [Meganyctiphanes norvegica]|uniref:Exonuclease domain-containing protein n=1 Tax=Meganyctiphanes norvegica TaxID=48144 RepID=A0AAV2SLP0_MEGNR